MQTFPVKIFNTSNPAGIDAEIAKVQAALAGIKWLDTIYGRATTQRRQLTPDEVKNRLTTTSGIKGRDLYFVFFPKGRKYDQDIDLSFSDDYPSCCYFYLRDPVNVSPSSDTWDFTEEQVQVAQPMSLILWADMKKLDPLRTDNFSEELKMTILSALNSQSTLVSRLVVNNVVETGEAVLRDFTVTQKNIMYTVYPYCAFRFDMVCTYPAFPENGNTAFNPATYIDTSRQSTQPNVLPGNPNLS